MYCALKRKQCGFCCAKLLGIFYSLSFGVRFFSRTKLESLLSKDLGKCWLFGYWVRSPNQHNYSRKGFLGYALTHVSKRTETMEIFLTWANFWVETTLYLLAMLTFFVSRTCKCKQKLPSLLSLSINLSAFSFRRFYLRAWFCRLFYFKVSSLVPAYFFFYSFSKK